MLGREYFNYPEVLIASFSNINREYKKISSRGGNFFTGVFAKIYIRIFGIPEIGFQLRYLFLRKILLKYVDKKNFKEILDAGSGIGAVTFELKSLYPKARIYGYDIDSTKIEISEKIIKLRNVRGVQFSNLNIEDQSLGRNKFDLIISIDVLEHIGKYEYVLTKFYRALRKNGYLYIHVPKTNRKRFFKRFDRRWHEDHLHDGIDSEILTNQLKDLGFGIVHKEDTFGFWGKLAWEIHHVFLGYNFFLGGLSYPLLYLVAFLDLFPYKKIGIGTAFLLKK